MINAKKNIFFEYFFAIYNKNLLKRRFNSILINGLENVKFEQVKSPVIFYANHSSWWDGLIAFQVSRKLKFNSFIMMEEKNLQKLFLFRFLGAFSVNKTNARQAIESLNYAISVLKSNQESAIWIFPQGEILPNDTRPIFVYNGISRIIKNVPKIKVVSVAIRFEFLDHFKPDVFISINYLNSLPNVKILTTKSLSEYLANNLTHSLDELKKDIILKNYKKFDNIIRPKA